MAKLIIEIPDDEYNYFMSDECFDADDGFDAIEYICNGKPLEQESILDKLRAEVAEYGSICAEYKMTGRSDKDIEQLVTDVLKQAKKQVLDLIDKYRADSEGRNESL